MGFLCHKKLKLRLIICSISLPLEHLLIKMSDSNKIPIELLDNEENDIGTITALFMHPVDPMEKMISVQSLELIAEKGILGNPRYYDTKNKNNGTQNKNHLSMTEQEQIIEFQEQLQQPADYGSVRSNVVTSGLCLDQYVGKKIQIGENVIIRVYKTRCSCKKMDICVKGLREIMKKGKPGVMAEILNHGLIRVGDRIRQID